MNSTQRAGEQRDIFYELSSHADDAGEYSIYGIKLKMVETSDSCQNGKRLISSRPQ